MAPLGRREGVRLGRVVMDGNVVHVSHSHGDLYRCASGMYMNMYMYMHM